MTQTGPKDTTFGARQPDQGREYFVAAVFRYYERKGITPTPEMVESSLDNIERILSRYQKDKN